MKSGKYKKKRTITPLWSLYQRSQQVLHEKVVNDGVFFFHLILLVLVVFNLDSFTHMHVREMFAAEEFGSLRLPPSDLTLKIQWGGNSN